MANKEMIMEQAESNLLHTYNRFSVVFDHGKDVYLYDVGSGNTKDITIYEVDEDGIAENVPCIFPKTILYAGSPFVSICAEYNKDINKAFEELYNAIISLGGNL